MSIWFTISGKKCVGCMVCAIFPLHMYRMHYFPLRIDVVMRAFCRIREYDTLLTFYFIFCCIRGIPLNWTFYAIINMSYGLVGVGLSFGTLTIHFPTAKAYIGWRTPSKQFKFMPLTIQKSFHSENNRKCIWRLLGFCASI